MTKNKNQKGFIVFIVVAAVVLLVTIFKFLIPTGEAAPVDRGSLKVNTRNQSLFSLLTRTPVTEKVSHRPGQRYIARLYIEGTIQDVNSTYNQEWLLDTIDELAGDPFNVGIILDINSPGGTVYEADELYLALLDYGKDKPVYAYFESMAASGGYYIACAAKEIVANRNTLTGSIGVIAGQSLDLTGLMEKYGVKSETIHAGKNKNMGNYNEPMTDEQRAILQSIADECYEQFTGIVADARDMSIEKVQELADGRVYTAKQALSAGLVDSIGTFDDAVSLMEEKEFEKKNLFVEDFKYERTPNFYDYLYGLSSKIAPGQASSITGLPEAIEKIIEPEVKYPAFIYEP